MCLGLSCWFPLVSQAAVTASTDQTTLGYLVTHKYALGVASNFNLFATDQYTQANSVGNARIAANHFTLDNWQQTLGWQNAVEGIDSHMLVINQLSQDANTLSTKLNSDLTTNLFAAEDQTTPVLHNTATPSQPVVADKLQTVTDFTDNGLTSFEAAKAQLTQLSAFYDDQAQLKAVFADHFLKTVDVPQSDVGRNQGVNTVVDDTDSETSGHKLLVVNVPAETAADLRENNNDVSIKIKYITKDKTEPIVVLNFPQLTGDFELYSPNDHVNVTYGPADNQSTIKDKNHLLLNFNTLDTLEFDHQFVGSVLAPSTTVKINQLNTNLTAIAAKDIAVNASVNTDGSQGVFNPSDFSDPANQTDGASATKKMNTTLFLKFADGRQATRSFDEDTTLNSTLKFDDQVNYYIDWAGYPDANLYESTNNQSWRLVTKGSSGEGQYDSTSDSDSLYPAREPVVTQSVLNNQLVFKAANRKTVRFALATQMPSDDNSQLLWSSRITYPLADFEMSLPSRINFDQVSDLNADEVTVRPSETPQVSVINTLSAPFDLQVMGDASVADPQDSQQNVFLDTHQFSYRDTKDWFLMTDPATLLQANPTVAEAVQRVTNGLDPPQVSQLSGFQLTVPTISQYRSASVGLKWRLTIGTTYNQ